MEENTIVADRFAEKTIGELVAQDFRKAEVFKRHGIDFCCRGNVTVNEVCSKKNIDAEALKRELEAVERQSRREGEDFNLWDATDLADYIVSVHHAYVERSLPVINEFMTKVCRVHGAHNPELYEIARNYNEVAEELTLHMQKEEMVLFPYIKRLNDAVKNHTSVERPPFGTVRNPIKMMEMEHISAGSCTENIKELSNNFTPPEHACATYRVLFAKLKEFEEDLHHHIHLENNILFKKAVEMEALLFKV